MSSEEMTLLNDTEISTRETNLGTIKIPEEAIENIIIQSIEKSKAITTEAINAITTIAMEAYRADLENIIDERRTISERLNKFNEKLDDIRKDCNQQFCYCLEKFVSPDSPDAQNQIIKYRELFDKSMEKQTINAQKVFSENMKLIQSKKSFFEKFSEIFKRN